MKQYRKIIVSVIFLAGVLLTSAQNAHAADTANPYSFTTQPTTLAVNASQGSSFHEDIIIQNQSTVYAMQATLVVQSFKAVNGSHTVLFYNAQGDTDNIAAWVKPELSEVLLKPQEMQYETLDFTIPDYVKSGTYSGVLFVQPSFKSPNNSSGSASHVDVQSGINIILTVFKNAAEYSSLYKAPIVQHLFVPVITVNGNPTLTGSIKNNGVFALSTASIVNVFDLTGKRVSHISNTDIDILPGNFRYLNGNTSTIALSSLQFGLYHVNVAVKDNLKGSKQTFILYFTVIPIYAIITFVILIALILLYVLYRKTKHKLG